MTANNAIDNMKYKVMSMELTEPNCCVQNHIIF